MTNQSEICKARSLFLTRGILNENVITKEIMHSWVRSKLHHISHEILDTHENKSKIDYANIGIKAKEIIQKIRQAQSEYSYIFVLDHQGQILYKNASKLNDLPELKCFTEESIGTNAAGISIKSKNDSKVIGCQHYNRNLTNFITESIVVDRIKEERYYIILLLTPLRYDSHHEKLYKQLQGLFHKKELESKVIKEKEYDNIEVNKIVNPVNRDIDKLKNTNKVEEERADNNDCNRFTLTVVEKQTISEALVYFNWNLKKTSEALGISRSTLYRKLKEYGLNKNS
jgi:transcriptional regulator of acetoin/glycerol metabolism